MNTTPPQDSQPRLPLRSFAMMLLSAAVVFFAVGWYSLNDSGNFDPNTAAQASAMTPEEQPEPAPQPAEETPETSEATTTTEAPTTTQLPPPPAPMPKIYVMNNSMTQGLAGVTATKLRNAGWPVAGTGNYGAGIVWVSTVFYGPNAGEYELAQRLANALGMSIAPRIAGLAGEQPGVVVVVTQDQVG